MPMTIFSPDEAKSQWANAIRQLISIRLRLLDNGWPVIPVGGKNFLCKGWTTGEITPERVAEESRVNLNKLNTGIRTGAACGVDNDLRNPVHAAGVNEVIEHFVGQTPLKRYGSKGAMLVYRNETPIRKMTMTDADGVRLFEVLGVGQQFVAFGKHPSGIQYRWDGANPYNTLLKDTPAVTPDQLQEMFDTVRELLVALGYRFPKKAKQDKAEVVTATPREPRNHDDRDEDVTELCGAALAATPNNLNREQWIAICFAIQDAGLGFDEWQKFCSRWVSGHNTQRKIVAAWNSCSPRSITYRTLLKYADDADPYWRWRYYWHKRISQQPALPVPDDEITPQDDEVLRRHYNQHFS